MIRTVLFILLGTSPLWSGVSVEGVLQSDSGSMLTVRMVQQEHLLKVSLSNRDVLLIRDGKSFVIDPESGYAMDAALLGRNFFTTNDLSAWIMKKDLKPTSLRMFVAGYPTQAYCYRNDKGQEAYLYFSDNTILKALMTDMQSLLEVSPAGGLGVLGALSDRGVLLAIQVNGRFVMKVNRIKPATYGNVIFDFPPKGILTMDDVIGRLKALKEVGK